MSDATETDTETEIDEEPAPTWPRVITLKHPFDFGKERRVTQIEMRRGKLADAKGIKLSDNVPMDHLVLIASRLSNEPTKVIEMLDVEDAGAVMEVALDFFTSCLGATTGRKHSR